MTTTPASPLLPPTPSQRALKAAKVIIVGSAMFTFISYWRTAAVVLCDLASTAFYIGGIVEQAIGPAAPWFILGVMLFSYAVRSVYIESCSLFVRGGVYKVVKEAMGGTLAKISVSALMFDYILTGPISGASAGQYLIGLILDSLQIIDPNLRITDEMTKKLVRNWGSVGIAAAITLYFGYKNLIGIHESSEKAATIMKLTTVMAVVMLLWCLVTLIVRNGPVNPIVATPDLGPKVQYQDASRFKLSESAANELRADRTFVQETAKQAVAKLHKDLGEREFDSAPRFRREVAQKLGYPEKRNDRQNAVVQAVVNQARLRGGRFKLGEDAIRKLQADQTFAQEAVTRELDRLHRSLGDRELGSEIKFRREVITAFGFPEPLSDQQNKKVEAVVSHAKMVERYKLTQGGLDNLEEDLSEKVPTGFLPRLSGIRDKEYKKAADFKAELAKLFTTPEEMALLKTYQDQIIGEAEVTEGIDRITGEKKPMWDRDPETQKLIPQKNARGDLRLKKNEVTGKVEHPLGFLRHTSLADFFENPGKVNWLTVFGVIGLLIAFGHSILAMSGEETLAQVYREVQSPKLPNFKKAAFIVFVYSLLFTATISFLAVWLIPDEVRMRDYSDNLIGGLAMYVVGLSWMRLALNGFVVVVGFLILAGAVNTAIIGSNGVLNRVAEDGVLPDWFLKPHPRDGTTYRLLYLIVAMQLAVLVVSQGNMLLLGEAYAFGVVWSFVFKALAMVVLRFKDRSPREFKVPLNIKFGTVEFPVGLLLIFLALATTAVLNFLTKEVATVSGVIFTVIFCAVFFVSERVHEKRRKGTKHEHLEQFNQETTEAVSAQALGLSRSFRKLVAIRSPQNLYMLERALAETDPDTTDVIVMTAKSTPPGDSKIGAPDLDTYDQHLMTAVVDRAEKAGKQVRPLIVPTNNPLFAVIRTAKDLQVQELVMGASNKYTADEQLEQIGFYWVSVQEAEPRPLTVRILGQGRDVYLDLNGGSRIPKISERKARSVAELRSAGVGVDRVLLVHDGSQAGKDLFQAVLTMLDTQVHLTIVPVGPDGQPPPNGSAVLQQEQDQAKQLDRELEVQPVTGDPGVEIVRLAGQGEYDLVILSLPGELSRGDSVAMQDWVSHILRNVHCRVFLAATPMVPQTVSD